MSYSIRWSPRAVDDISNQLDYIEQEWNRTVVNKFLNRIEDVLETITDNPKLFPLIHKKKAIHRCVINSHLVLYYRLSGTQIELITFWNTSKNPENLPLD